MGRSRYTVSEYIRNATRDIPQYEQNSAVYTERYDLINRVQELVQGMFADLVAEAYMTETTAVLSTTGKYYSSGASWDTDTDSLTATMDTSWASTDVGNLVIFRDGTSVYVGTITSRTSATVVVLTGDNLPAADIATVNDVMMAATTISGDSINVSSLKILRYGTQMNINLRSTVTDQFDTLARSAFFKWDSTDPRKRNTIAWTLIGTTIYLNKGSDVSSYGTITIEYPSLPTVVSADGDTVDLLDGAMAQIGLNVLRAKIQRRLQLPIPEGDKNDTRELITMLYNSFNQDVKKELVEQKLESLL